MGLPSIRVFAESLMPTFFPASAAEMAADAFRASGIATLVGERTAGEMLSQSMFDIADGFIVTLPVADFYSMQHGRIEGVGVQAHIGSSSEKALETAKELAVDRE